MLSKLECVKISEVKPLKFEFKNFLAQFQNCNAFGSNELKSTLLKICLSDYVLQLISHLTLESRNYRVAIDLLKREFFSYKPKYNPEYFNINQFLAEIRAHLKELKG